MKLIPLTVFLTLTAIGLSIICGMHAFDSYESKSGDTSPGRTHKNNDIDGKQNASHHPIVKHEPLFHSEPAFSPPRRFIEPHRHNSANSETPIVLSDKVVSDHLKLVDLGLDIDYIIPDALIMTHHGILEIDPGVTILMNSQLSVLILRDYSTLIVRGTPNNPVIFKSPENIPWQGIRIVSGSYDHELNHVVIENAAADLYAVQVNSDAHLKADGLIIDSANNGLILKHSSVLTSISNSTIRNCRYAPIILQNFRSLLRLGKNNHWSDNTDSYIYIRDSWHDGDQLRIQNSVSNTGVPYCLSEGFKSSDKTSVIIDPGTELLFARAKKFHIDNTGHIQINGTAEAPVIMRGRHNRKNFWGGIYLKTHRLSTISHLRLENAGHGNSPAIKFAGTTPVRLDNLYIDDYPNACIDIDRDVIITDKMPRTYTACRIDS